jgi:hypothetical protein
MLLASSRAHSLLLMLTVVVSCCRPDVLPPPVLAELSKLQDRLAPFSTPGA